MNSDRISGKYLLYIYYHLLYAYIYCNIYTRERRRKKDGWMDERKGDDRAGQALHRETGGGGGGCCERKRDVDREWRD